MPNHFHLVVETPRGNLVAGMKWFLGTYTSRFNRRHKLFGHLFSGRYKSLIVDRGRQRQRIFADGVRLRAFESGAGEVAGTGRPAAGLSLEQLWRILEKSAPASELVADGPCAGRNGHSQRQRRRTRGI